MIKTVRFGFYNSSKSIDPAEIKDRDQNNELFIIRLKLWTISGGQ
jgi:hypothetical protein